MGLELTTDRYPPTTSQTRYPFTGHFKAMTNYLIIHMLYVMVFRMCR